MNNMGKSTYEKELEKYNQQLKELDSLIKKKKNTLTYLESPREVRTTAIRYDMDYTIDTVNEQKGTKDQLDRLKQEIEELNDKMVYIANNKEKLAREAAEEIEKVANDESEQLQKEIDEDNKSEREKKESTIRQLKYAYKKGPFVDRVFNSLAGKKPNWKKITSEYSEEELDHLKSESSKSWGHFCVLLTNKKKLDASISAEKENEEESSSMKL